MPHPDYLEIRPQAVPTEETLTFDLYVSVDKKAVCLRKQGEILTRKRLQKLIEDRVKALYVPASQSSAYLKQIRHHIQNEDEGLESRSRFLKQSALIHVQDLFTRPELEDVLASTRALVEDMVNLVSSDVTAAASLMSLTSHDYYTYNHSVDVGVYSIVLSRKIFGEDRELLIKAGMGGLLHDLGKRKVPIKILNKKGKLTAPEWEEMKRHAEYGYELVKDLKAVPLECKAVVHEHHENYNGTGYPRKLKGDEIAPLARVVAIADVFDALTTDRPYHHGVSGLEALRVMFGMQPGKFDPNLFLSFDKNFKEKASKPLPPDFDPCEPRPRAKKKVA